MKKSNNDRYNMHQLHAEKQCLYMSIIDFSHKGD